MKHGVRLFRPILASLLLASLLLAGLPNKASAAPGTTVGTLSLVPAFEQISVYSNFTNDDDADARAYVEYRQVGSTQWKRGVDLTPDRRDQLAEFDEAIGGPRWIPNPYKNQFRGIIFGLQTRTQYEVRVTYIDPDGVTGSPVTATVTTRDDNPPSNGPTKPATPSTLATVLAGAQPGDIISLAPGTYAGGLDITVSGQTNNYITIQSADTNNKAVISGGGWNVRLMGNYIRLRGLSLRNPTGDPGSNVQVGSDSGNVATGNIIEDSIMVDPPTANWASAGVLLRGSKNTLIQRNSMQTTVVAARGQSYGIFFWGAGDYGGNVIRDNNITSEGTFRDSIGGSGNFQVGAGPGPDSFMYDNYLYGSYDDGIESEGGNMNVAIFNNVIKNNNQATDAARMINGIGLASVVIGPVYAMRNVIISPREGTFKVGSSSYGTVHLYHNIAYQAGYGLIFTSGNNRIAENYIVRNNITQGTGRVMGHYTDTIPLAQQTDTFDYDIVYASGDWFGFWYGIRYETLAALKSATTHEQNSKDANPAFVNPGGGDFTLQAASPAIDAGVLIPGLNDADSPWPYQGAAPDIGVYEYGSGPPTNSPPVLAAIGNKSVTAGQLLNFTVSATDPNGDTLTYSASNLPSGATFNAGTRTFSWTPTTGQVGTYANVNFQVSDGSLTDSESITITVSAPTANQPPVLAAIGNKSVTAGQLLSFTISATDPNGDTLTYSASNLPSGATFNAGTRTFSWTPTTGQAGTYANVNFQVSDGSLTDSESITITVTAPASGQSTTTGTLSLASTIVSVSVYASFSGDTNGNNQATLEYREAGSASWKPGITMTVDRRDVLTGAGSIANPYKNQWRASVFWLNPDTTYEVRVTYADAEGVVGTNPVTASVRTRKDVIPVGTGTKYYVSTTGSDTNPGTEAAPFRTIQKAANTVQSGATVYIKAGTYNESVTISASGANADNYIIFSNYATDEVWVDSNGLNSNNFALSGNYIMLRGIKMRNAWNSGVYITGANNRVENSRIEEWARRGDTGYADDWLYAGIMLYPGTNSVIRGNTLYKSTGYYTFANSSATGNAGPGMIMVRNTGTGAGGGHVIAGNRLETSNGQVKDGIGSAPEDVVYGGIYKDTDIYDNTIINAFDDSIQVEGGDINSRIWGNTLQNNANSGLAISPNVVGPLYFIRNVMINNNNSGGVGAFKTGSAGTGRVYAWHNTIYNSQSGGKGPSFGGGTGFDGIEFKNNIVFVTSYAYNFYNTSYDRNNMWMDYNSFQAGSTFARWWNTSYGSLSAFSSGTGQDTHSVTGNPLFVNAAAGNFNLQSTSPSIDKGTVLVQINDADSPWPYQAAAPDAGAFEYASGPPTNQPPVLAAIGNKSVTAGQLVTFTISATDPNGDTLTYSASNLPSGASFNAGTRAFSWTPTTGQVGTYPNVYFQVSDGSLTDSESITITVNAANSPPVLAAIGNKSVTTGQLLSFTISATDPNGDTLTYFASNLPSGASFNAGTRTFSWTPTTGQVGTYSNVTFQVSDGSLTDSESITITVNAAANQPPVLAAIGNKSVTAGQLLSFTISATDPNGDALTYSASNLPSGATFNAGTRTFSWTPTTAQVGTYSNVTFQVSDGSLTDSESIIITVTSVPTNQPPVLATIGNKSVTEGQLLSFTVSATDPNGDTLTYSASNLPSGASFNAGTRAFSWTPTTAQVGTYPNIYFQVSDGLLTDLETITIVVNAANQSPVLAAIGNKSVTEGQLLSFTVSATDPNGDTLTYSASNLPSGASFNGTTRAFTWTPTTGQAGTYANVDFQVSDGSLTDSESITITVNAAVAPASGGGGGGGGGGALPPPPNASPVLSSIGDKSVTEGQLLQFTISATDTDGDTLTYSASNLPSGASFDQQTGIFSWTPASGQAGTYSGVHFEVSDGKVAVAEDITITVDKPVDTSPEIRSVASSEVTSSSVVIRWTTDEPSTSQVEYWASPPKLSPLDERLLTDHVVQLTGLASGTTYHYRTMSRDTAGNLATSTESTFTTLGTPAAFTVSQLQITPSEVLIGEQVTISVVVTNTGETSGDYKVTFTINGVLENTTTVTLSGGTSDKATFTTTEKAAGVYKVEVNGLTGSFTVKEKSSTSIRQPQAKRPWWKFWVKQTEPASSPKVVSWATLGIIIGVTLVVIIATVLIVLYRRREMLKGNTERR